MSWKPRSLHGSTYLFGVNGFREPESEVSISLLGYFQYQIQGQDCRFQGINYLFYALSMFEFERIRSTISACGKPIQGRNEMVEDVHLYIQKIRGSSAYWRKALNKLIAQIWCLGPPTYLITINCLDIMCKALLGAVR